MSKRTVGEIKDGFNFDKHSVWAELAGLTHCFEGYRDRILFGPGFVNPYGGARGDSWEIGFEMGDKDLGE